MSSALAAYEADRRNLIAQDRAYRADHRRSWTDKEVRADEVVREIRAEEAKTVWSADYPSIPHTFPGMEFLTGKAIIEKTKLFGLLCKMPKGALLHAHLDATVNAEKLYSLGLEQTAMHISVHEVVTKSNIRSNVPRFLALREDQISADTTLSVTTHPQTYVQLQTARKNFPAELGGPEGFDKWVIGSMTINPSEAYGTHNTIKKIWQKFASIFRAMFGLVRYRPIFEQYVREFFLTSIEDGIFYVEPRVNMFFEYDDGSGFGADISTIVANDYQDNRESVRTFARVLNEVKESLRQQGREDEFVGAQIIYSTLRFIDRDELKPYMEDCIALKKEFPDIIAGFDLVGDENELKPLIYYAEPLLWFKERQKEEGIAIPYILHAGETLGDGTEADMNLYDAILLGTKRIGHGFSLVKHPKLMEICRERNIALEVCPISNEILRLTSSMPMHPLPILFNYGVSVALCSDDPCVFGSMGLSYDYYQVIAASEATGLLQLAEVARNSLNLSMLDDDAKTRAVAAWDRQWAKFLDILLSSAR